MSAEGRKRWHLKGGFQNTKVISDAGPLRREQKDSGDNLDNVCLKMVVCYMLSSRQEAEGQPSRSRNCAPLAENSPGLQRCSALVQGFVSVGLCPRRNGFAVEGV